MVTYKNFKGSTYYLKVGPTKTGKLRYFVSTDPFKWRNAEAMSEGYTFREYANGLVSVGKIQPQYIDAAEFAKIKPYLDALEVAFKTEVKGKSIIIHTFHVGEGLEDSPLFSSRRALNAWIRETAAVYEAMLKFTRVDERQGLYQTEWKCFLGDMPWILIGDMAPLEQLAQKYIPLLDDEEALFEEIY